MNYYTWISLIDVFSSFHTYHQISSKTYLNVPWSSTRCYNSLPLFDYPLINQKIFYYFYISFIEQIHHDESLVIRILLLRLFRWSCNRQWLNPSAWLLKRLSHLVHLYSGTMCSCLKCSWKWILFDQWSPHSQRTMLAETCLPCSLWKWKIMSPSIMLLLLQSRHVQT